MANFITDNPFMPTTLWHDDQKVVNALQDLRSAILALQAQYVTGEVRPYAGSSAPAGFLLCNGQAVSRTTYAALFAVIGTTYGTGDGSTTFNVPDLRGRAPIGAGTGTGLTNRVLGTGAGEETHLNTASESGTAAHTHTSSATAASTVTDTGHAHQVASRLGDTTADTASVNRWMSNGPADGFTNAVVTNSQSATTGISVATSVTPTVNAASAASAASAHNNMQPWLAINFIIAT